MVGKQENKKTRKQENKKTRKQENKKTRKQEKEETRKRGNEKYMNNIICKVEYMLMNDNDVYDVYICLGNCFFFLSNT